MLQRLLLAFCVARPSAVLQLKNCRRRTISFELTETEATKVLKLTEKYLNAVSRAKEKMGEDEGDEEAGKWGISYAVKAQLRSLHPLLGTEIGDVDYDPQDHEVADDADPATRTTWLRSVETDATLCHSSSRLKSTLALYAYIIKEKPGEKIIIFFQYLKFLDILSESLRRCFDVRSLRYDGTVSPAKRMAIKEQFRNSERKEPLLITAEAGGIGFNIVAASVMIQTEL